MPSSFNALPRNVGEKTLAEYSTDPATAGLPYYQKFPFPGGKGKIWHCTAAQMTTAEATDPAVVSGLGSHGFFSYEMNIDLKRSGPLYTLAAAYGYPRMPKMNNVPSPSATVLLFDSVFNKNHEINGNAFSSVNPANRWRSYASRHGVGAKGGGIICFLDGHAQFYSYKAVTNGITGGAPGATEAPGSPIVWNPPYRAANP